MVRSITGVGSTLANPNKSGMQLQFTRLGKYLFFIPVALKPIHVIWVQGREA